MKTGVLLVNLGTPDSPSTADVRKYLTEFLNDSRVIDINPVGRFFLVNFLIIPFRSSKSAALYKHIWHPQKGSPLLFHGLSLKEKLQADLGDRFIVEFGMRYQNPPLQTALENLRKQMVSKIIVIPLYPQYSSSATGSSIQKIMEIIKGWEVTPSMEFISEFYRNEGFINTFSEIGSKYNWRDYDHVLFSYHGLPERQILKASDHYGKNTCKLGSCCESLTARNQYCYRAACFDTTRSIATKLEIPKEKYSVSFQSRLGRDPWIKPYSDHVIIEKAKQGMKKILVFSPAFVADCLETIYEIGTEYDELFKEHGGEKIQLVESLNDHPKWVETISNMVRNRV